MKMNKKLLSTGIFLSLFGFAGLAQNAPSIVPKNFTAYKNTPTLNLTPPNMDAIRLEDEQRDKNGEMYRIGVANYTNITTQNSGAWSTDAAGNRVWQLHIHFPGAEALSFLFERFHIYGSAKFDVFDNSGRKLHETYTVADVLDHGRQNMELCFGDDMILQLTEPAGTPASDIYIDRVMYGYRSTGNPNQLKDFGDSDNCEINVNCSPVGDSWQDERNGVARILVVDGSLQGWCTGSLINNTAQDCKPYFLTALHCGVTSTTANFTQWKFYFKYEASGCTSPSSQGSLGGTSTTITGCVKTASSNDNGGDSGSDFLLVQLGSIATEATTVTKLKTAAISAYWNGWDVNNTATTGGVGIHHPAGDIKKISTFSGATTSTTWGGTVANTHWRVTWTANSNGHGVTEGGSSGSPLFNNSNGRIIGTLTGGGSYCTALTSPDSYGKMSFHWTSNGTPTNEQLKPFLDPGNTGATTLNGSSDPCSAVTPTAPVANFVGNPTTLNPGQTVTFTDQSTNTPTSWLWAISPATGWTFTTGTTTSQNPVVTFNTVGQYTITLTATNASGSDQEIKTNYITVTSATAPCTAASTIGCATGDANEYIAGVQLNTLSNTSNCSTYTSGSTTTTLSKGSAYTATITTAIVGTTTTAYVDDELAIWIDYNGDLDFNDAGEQVGYSIATASAFNTVFNFTVPTSAVTGTVKMRVRMHYSGSDVGDGPISPCGDYTYGEVEDYNISIIAGSTSGLSEEVLLDAVSVYPNPVNNTLNADFSTIDIANLQVELLDVTGKVLATQTNVSGTIAQFDMSNYAKGMYHIRLSAGSIAATRRVVKI
jgi:lysyl endopeptidase